MMKFKRTAKMSLTVAVVMMVVAWGLHKFGNSIQYSKQYVLFTEAASEIIFGNKYPGCKEVRNGLNEPFFPVIVGGRCLLRNVSASQESTFAHPLFWTMDKWIHKGDGEDMINITFTERESNLNFEFRFISKSLRKIDEASGKILFGNEYCYITSPNGKVIHAGRNRAIIDESKSSMLFDLLNEFEQLASNSNEIHVDVYLYNRNANRCQLERVHRMTLGSHAKRLIYEMVFVWKFSRYDMVPNTDKRMDVMEDVLNSLTNN